MFTTFWLCRFGAGLELGRSQLWPIVFPLAGSTRRPEWNQPGPATSGSGQNWTDAAQLGSGVPRRCCLRGEDCQNSLRLRDSPAAAVHMEAEGGGEGMEPREGVWLMSARLGSEGTSTSWRAARRVEAARAGSGPRRRRKPARQAEEAPSNISRLVTAVCHTESWTWGRRGRGRGGCSRICNSSVKTPQPFLSCLSGNSTGSSFKRVSSELLHLHHFA